MTPGFPCDEIWYPYTIFGSGYTYHQQVFSPMHPGGGGGGGALWITTREFEGDGVVDLRGGAGGPTRDGSTGWNVYGGGGEGAPGALRLETVGDPPPRNLADVIPGKDVAVTTGDAERTDTATTRFIFTDQDVVYTGYHYTGSGVLRIRFQGADEDPDTGEPDPETYTSWTVTPVDLDGKPFLRIEIVLEAVPGFPAVSQVTVEYESTAKDSPRVALRKIKDALEDRFESGDLATAMFRIVNNLACYFVTTPGCPSRRGRGSSTALGSSSYTRRCSGMYGSGQALCGPKT